MLKQKVSGSVQEVILPDFPDDDTTFTTTVTKSRRVSFGPNFVKEFIADSAVSAQCMTEYEQPFPSSDSSSADSSHSVHSTFVVHENGKQQAEANESRFKPPKFASTICFSTDSPTADMEFTEGCITLAKSILDKKNKEMSVFIQAKSKEPKEEEKGKEEETNYFDGSQFEMSMTGCMRSKENKREERRFVSEKTRIFGRYDNEMSMTRCERFVDEGDSEHSMEDTKDGRMLLDAIMRHLDKDSSDSDLFNPERSFGRSGANPFEMSDELDLNESMEISGEVGRGGPIENLSEKAVERSHCENSHNLTNGGVGLLSNALEGACYDKSEGVRLGDDTGNQSKGPAMSATFESEPVLNCCEKSSEAMEISFGIQQDPPAKIPLPEVDENRENLQKSVQQELSSAVPFAETEDENPISGFPENAEHLQQNIPEDLSSAVSPPKIRDENSSLGFSGNAENLQQSIQEDGNQSSAVSVPEIRDENPTEGVLETAENSQQSVRGDLSSAVPLSEVRDENPTGGLQLEEMTSELHNSRQSIQQDSSAEMAPLEEKINESSTEGLLRNLEEASIGSALVENPPPCADVSCGSLECEMPETGAELQSDEPAANPLPEDMDITESIQVPAEPEDIVRQTNPILDEEVSTELPRNLPAEKAINEEEKAIPMKEDDSTTEPEPILGDLKVIESLKEQSKEPGCVWSLKDQQHPRRRGKGLISFTCRLLESTASVEFILKRSNEDSLDSCSIVTDSRILLDEDKQWKLPEYELVVGFGFEELKKHFEGNRQRVEKIRHVPYFLDQINSFLSRMNGYLGQIYSVLTSYPGSRLRGSLLSFRLFSFPIFFSCVVAIDLSNLFRLSKASLSFEHDFGGLDERTVGEIFEECLKRENSLCEFVVQTTRYLINLERESGYVSKRGHIRLLPEELK